MISSSSWRTGIDTARMLWGFPPPDTTTTEDSRVALWNRAMGRSTVGCTRATSCTRRRGLVADSHFQSAKQSMTADRDDNVFRMASLGFRKIGAVQPKKKLAADC